MESDNRSIMMDNTSIISFSEQSFFSANPDSQKVVEFQEDEYQPLAQYGYDISLEEMNEKESQDTTDVEAQGSQSVGRYSKPPVLT